MIAIMCNSFCVVSRLYFFIYYPTCQCHHPDPGLHCLLPDLWPGPTLLLLILSYTFLPGISLPSKQVWRVISSGNHPSDSSKPTEYILYSLMCKTFCDLNFVFPSKLILCSSYCLCSSLCKNGSVFLLPPQVLISRLLFFLSCVFYLKWCPLFLPTWSHVTKSSHPLRSFLFPENFLE